MGPILQEPTISAASEKTSHTGNTHGSHTTPRGPDADPPQISVLIAAIRDSPLLRTTLEIIRAQADPERVEILLVFNVARNAVRPAALITLQRFCDRIEFEPEPGKSAALNTGIALARGEVIAFTDDDTLPGPCWLEEIHERLLDPQRDPSLVAMGGPVIPTFPAETPPWFKQLVLSRETHYIGPRHDYGPEPLDYPIGDGVLGGVCIGANFAVRREVFETLSFSQRLGPNPRTGLRGGEDTALAHEILKRKLRISYEPRAFVQHPIHLERATYEFVRDAYFVHGREAVLARRELGLPPFSILRLIRRPIKHRLKKLRARRAEKKANRQRGSSGADGTEPESAYDDLVLPLPTDRPLSESQFGALLENLWQVELHGRLRGSLRSRLGLV